MRLPQTEGVPACRTKALVPGTAAASPSSRGPERYLYSFLWQVGWPRLRHSLLLLWARQGVPSFCIAVDFARDSQVPSTACRRSSKVF